jgi:hypothetical protein
MGVPRRILACAVVAVAILMLALPVSAVRTDWIDNGGFEQYGAYWNWYNVDYAGGFYGNGLPGLAFVLNAGGEYYSDPTLYQTVTGLTVGQKYTLSGNYRWYHTSSGSPVNAFTVSVDNLASEDFDLSDQWGTFSLNFTAASTSHTVYLMGERYGSDYSTEVDNISLKRSTGVPESPAIILALIGGISTLSGRFLCRRR